MVGNPAKQIGWVSEYGHRLHFDENNRGRCIESGDEYEIFNSNEIKKIK